MLPWIVVLSAVGIIINWLCFEGFGLTSEWKWPVVAKGVAEGVAASVVLGVAAGVAFGVTASVGVGVAVPFVFWFVYFRLLTYPLDTMLSAIAYFMGRWRQDILAQAWRICPVSWNEVIWLPLPFVSKLLVLMTQRNREESFRQIAFVTAERRLQRSAALKALLKITINDLHAESVSELSNITEKLSWTIDAPIDLPVELNTSLPRFERIAQHVEQYHTLNGMYRKSEALKHAIDEIEALQKSLITIHRKFAPDILRAANEWRRLLEEEHEQIRIYVDSSKEIPNPFIFGNPVTETEYNVFTGRKDIVIQIEESVLGAIQLPMLLLHGPRRMGKTSILNQLPRLLGPDFAPAVLDCQDPAVTGSLTTLLEYVSKAISIGLLRRRVAVQQLTHTELEHEPFSIFNKWLDSVEQIMPPNMRALLCLDEYERLKYALDEGWGRKFLDYLRHTFQYRSHVVIMFCGSHTFEELGPEWTDRFISARRIRVSFLTQNEVLPLLTKPIPEFDMTYTQEALEAIYCATNGQPFLTQAVAFELVQFLNQQHRKNAEIDDVEKAITHALVSGGEYFANVWYDAGEDGQAILRAVVKDDIPPDFPSARTRLREQDILNNNGEFIVPMVKRWVKKKTQ